MPVFIRHVRNLPFRPVQDLLTAVWAAEWFSHQSQEVPSMERRLLYYEPKRPDPFRNLSRMSRVAFSPLQKETDCAESCRSSQVES